MAQKLSGIRTQASDLLCMSCDVVTKQVVSLTIFFEKCESKKMSAKYFAYSRFGFVCLISWQLLLRCTRNRDSIDKNPNDGDPIPKTDEMTKLTFSDKVLSDIKRLGIRETSSKMSAEKNRAPPVSITKS
jgi:hypothetical protein